ncbi:Ser/Thr protein kinase RdoA (MazF antagonist) [Sporosarcina luteola]|nr:Ser/Thr protein kinase RdoA (MazF antagonist) [Sporosarcina luteola]
MQDFFHLDRERDRTSLLKRARNVALKSLQQYDVDWDSIQFVQLSDAITFKITMSGNEGYLLRIHSDRWSKEEIHSELTLLQALNESDDLTVPEGIQSIEGSYVIELDPIDGYRGTCVTMMRWVEGEHSNGKFTDDCVYQMGLLMGRLHNAAASFDPPFGFVRPAWGAESFMQEMTKLEHHYACFLSKKAWDTYQVAAEKVLAQLAGISQNDKNYGLIHGDLHTGNIVFKDDQPYPIDFGRSGYGYYLYDIAGTIVGLAPKHRLQFIEGYESVRKLEANHVRDVECFFIMVMIENYCHHASNPRETSGLIAEQPYAQAYIRNYLYDTPFVFETIQPVQID